MGPVAAWSAECSAFCSVRETSISDNESRIAAQDETAAALAVATTDSTSSRSMRRRPNPAIRRTERAKLLIEQQAISNVVSVGSSRRGISIRRKWRNAFRCQPFGCGSHIRRAIEGKFGMQMICAIARPPAMARPLRTRLDTGAATHGPPFVFSFDQDPS
ncbi:hypothetical protein [Burkholderia territorii]|uniref:hypothetical protein n=1 Tax=Burkholderia territorii TaxID=1503055 RepID=UPI0012D9DAE2|nr:hypothetical protein [Burkholderia territorii]